MLIFINLKLKSIIKWFQKTRNYINCPKKKLKNVNELNA